MFGQGAVGHSSVLADREKSPLLLAVQEMFEKVHQRVTIGVNLKIQIRVSL